MSANGRREVLRLYRAILRRGDSLLYTDKEFFIRTVRHEFKKYSLESRKDEVSRHIEVTAMPYIHVHAANTILSLSQQKAEYFLSSDLGGMI